VVLLRSFLAPKVHKTISLEIVSALQTVQQPKRIERASTSACEYESSVKTRGGDVAEVVLRSKNTQDRSARDSLGASNCREVEEEVGEEGSREKMSTSPLAP
jgi:hypothetical protein